jgi:hypothetical protein
MDDLLVTGPKWRIVVRPLDDRLKLNVWEQLWNTFWKQHIIFKRLVVDNG